MSLSRRVLVPDRIDMLDLTDRTDAFDLIDALDLALDGLDLRLPVDTLDLALEGRDLCVGPALIVPLM